VGFAGGQVSPPAIRWTTDQNVGGTADLTIDRV
jgi:hypothetical protein